MPVGLDWPEEAEDGGSRWRRAAAVAEEERAMAAINGGLGRFLQLGERRRGGSASARLRCVRGASERRLAGGHGGGHLGHLR
jgi:hypothetical protein